MVELRGLEPLTPCMPCKCATNCATAPKRRPVYRGPTAACGPCSASVVPGLLLRRRPGVVLLEPPAAAHVGQQRPPTVRQRCQSPPSVRVHSEQRADRGPGGTTVRDGDQQRTGPEPVQPVADTGRRPRPHLGVRLPAAATRVLPRLPPRVLLGEPRPGLRARQALPVAEE